MKQRKTSYPLTIALSTLSILIPLVAVGYIFYLLVHLKQEIGLLENAILFVSFTQWVMLKKPLKNMYQKAIQDNEYDELGMSKKKKFENLTRKEREEMDLQKFANMERLLSTSVLHKIQKKGSTNPEDDLNSLIGIQSVKDKTNEMVARMKFEIDVKKSSKKSKKGDFTGGMSGRHMVFYGSAGTGKTTVARIITGFLYKYKYIKQNKFIEIDGNFLKAGEDSATKTKMIIQKAYGGVLFIDEAYTIVDGSGGYGKEVIATLIKEMEDNRDKLIIILAGYKNGMKRLLDSNEGFKSRIKEYFNFPDYNTEEMKQIFMAMAHSSGFAVSEDALKNFEIRCEKERKLSSFGNGRTARNILDETIDRHALNYGQGKLIRKSIIDGKEVVIGNNENRFILCGCDVSTSTNKAVL